MARLNIQVALETATAIAGFNSIAGAATQAVGAIVGGFADAQKQGEAMSRQLIDVASQLREISAIKGKFGPDDEEVRKFIAFRQQTGLTHEQAMGFQGQLLNALGTVPMAKFGEAEREKLAILGGQTASRMGGDASAARARATVLGLLPGFMSTAGPQGQPMPITAERVATLGVDVEDILQRGNMMQGPMTQQFATVMSSLAGPEGAGLFRDPRKAAAMTAIASKFAGGEGGGQTATSILQFARAMRGFTKFRKTPGTDASQAETLEQMGIGEFDDPQVAAEKMFKFIDRETQGGKTEAVDAFLARRGFRDQTGNRRIAQFFQSYKGGEWQDIMGMADRPVGQAQPGGKTPAERYREYMAGAPGRDAQNQVEQDAARLEQGRLRRELMLQRDAAKAQVIREGGLTDMGMGTATRAGLGALGMVPGVGGNVPDFATFEAERRVMQRRGGGLAQFNAMIDSPAGTAARGLGLGVPGLLMPFVRDIAASMTGANAQLINGDVQQRILEETKRANAQRAAQANAPLPAPPAAGAMRAP